jgi:hypothetical protein
MDKRKCEKMTVWAERIGALDLVALSFRAPGCAVRYEEEALTPASSLLLRALRGIGRGGRFQSAGLSQHLKDDKGCAAYYRCYENIEFISDVFAGNIMAHEPKWFRDAVKSKITAALRLRVNFLTLVSIRIAAGRKDERHEVLLKNDPMNHLLTPLCSKEGFGMRESFGFLERARLVLTPFYYVLTFIRSSVMRSKMRGNVDGSRPAVWVEYEGLDVIAKTMLIFWRSHIRSSGFDAVYYIDRPDTPVSEAVKNHCAEAGLKWIDLRDLFGVSPIKFVEMCFAMGELFRYGSYPLWLRVMKMRFAMLKSSYERLYKRFNVKILIQHQEHYWQQAAQREALEAAGGIMVGFQWSHVPYVKLPSFYAAHHLYFVWGKASHEWLRRKGNTCRYILPSGLWIGGGSCGKGFAAERRHASGEKYRVAILDSGFGGRLDEQTPESLNLFYMSLFRLLEDNPGWVGVVKSKCFSEKDYSNYLDANVSDKIRSLTAAKKIRILDRTLSPVDAASHADISICFGINSAGIVAGVHGLRAVHWDCSGWLHHPIYRVSGQKVLFDSMDDLKEAVVRSSRGDEAIGDFGRWAGLFNYFDDLRAPERVAEFIEYIMSDMEVSENSKDSLDRAVRRYVDKNKVGPDFFAPGNWWSDERSRSFEEVCA